MRTSDRTKYDSILEWMSNKFLSLLIAYRNRPAANRFCRSVWYAAADYFLVLQIAVQYGACEL